MAPRPFRSGLASVSSRLASVSAVLAFGLVAGAVGDPASVAASPSLTPETAVSASALAEDMTIPNTSFPEGVPSTWSWYHGGEVSDGDQPPAGYTGLTGWGTVYAASTGTAASNVRVELRDEETWVFSKSAQVWDKVQASEQPTGQLYYDDLAGNYSVPADLRDEADGGVSVKMEPGYSLQFWPQGARASIDPSDIGGVVTTVEAKLVPDDPSGPDDLAEAHYLVNAGADYWKSPTAPYPDNSEVFISRFQPVSTGWTIVGATTFTEGQRSAPQAEPQATRPDLLAVGPPPAASGAAETAPLHNRVASGRLAQVPTALPESPEVVWLPAGGMALGGLVLLRRRRRRLTANWPLS